MIRLFVRSAKRILLTVLLSMLVTWYCSQRYSELLDDDSCVFEKNVLVELANKGELMSYIHTGFWQCMDNVREKSILEKLLAEDKAPWKRWERSVPKIPEYAK